MSGILAGAFAVVLTGIVLCTCLHAAIVVVLIATRRRSVPRWEGQMPPVTWFRPLKVGVRHLPDKLRVFQQAIDPGDQVILGVDPGSETAVLAAEFALQAGDHVTVMECRPGAARNPKTSKLLQMAAAATHEHWIIVDAEAVVDREFIQSIRAEWLQKGAVVLSCGYRFSGATNWPQRLDAMSTILTLWPGLEIVSRLGEVRFTLGACTALRRTDVEALGGWESLGDELAEDYWLGARLSASGHEVALSDAVITLDTDPMSWNDYWRHQIRVAVTYRAAQPAGTAGMILTRGVTAALLCIFLHPWLGLILLILALLTRLALAEAVTCRRGFTLEKPVGLVLVADVVEVAAWARAWFARSVWWGGRTRRVTWRGKLKD